MANLIRGIAVAAVAAACGLTSLRAAEPAKPAAKKSLDDALLEGLDNELSQEIDELPSLKPQPGPTAKPGDDKTAEPPPIDGEDLGQSGEAKDPFGHIARRMKRVESRIARDRADADTQHQQAEIVNDLAALIEKLNQQCQQCRGGECKPGDKPQDSQRSKPSQASKPGESKSGTSPARDSTTKLHNDAVAKPNAEEIRQTMKDAWGNLPERLREQMLQTSVDEFLPKYESMIEQYFKRLAEDEKLNSK